MKRLKVEGGKEGKVALPAWLKIILLLGLIILVSVVQDRLIIMACGALVLVRLAMMPAGDIWGVLKTTIFAGVFCAVLVTPAVIMDPVRLSNSLRLVLKVMICVTAVGEFNRTTQWNHVTGALRKFHVPGVIIFIMDITFRYIVLLGKLMEELLTAVELRSVGRNDKKYASVGGIMGVTFLRGSEMNKEMYEAMQCRGFTDDYEGL